MSMQIHDLFDEQVKKNPHKIALCFKGETLTYLELAKKSNQISNSLIIHGASESDIIAVNLSRGFELIATLIGILRAGCAYLPLDKDYPKERLNYMLNHSRAKLLISDNDNLEYTRKLDLNNIDLSRDDHVSKKGSLAYVIYTSGSTGQPKGVCLDHSALINLLKNQKEENYGMGTLQFTPVSFDVHFQEIFATLLSGACLYLIDEFTRLDFNLLLDEIEGNKIERIFLPFVALNKLTQVAHGQDRYPESLKAVITAGEQLRITDSIKSFFKRTQAALYNHYGPSETHVVTSKKLDGDPMLWEELPSIGSILKGNVYKLIKNENNEDELCVGGKSVGQGYLHDKVKTDEKFYVEDNQRFYKTGDIVEIKAGEIYYLKRADDQIKIRGYRVELGEIENKIASFLSDVQVCAKTFQLKSGESYICCYIEGDFDEKKLRSSLAGALPDYMIPRFLERVLKMPLLPSGKVDRKKLIAPSFTRPDLINEYVAPKTQLEKKIAQIWINVLNVDRVGMDDTFFEMGGTSLGAISILEDINKLGKNKMSIADLFSLATIRAQAKFIEATSVKREKKSGHEKTRDIAIIAMAGVFPGANDIDELAQLLEKGECGLQDIHTAHPSQREDAKKSSYVFKKGEIETAKFFDHQFFGMTPREAELMDPQQRKFLELSYNALEASGYIKERKKLKIGVYAGCANNTYFKNLADYQDKIKQLGEFNVMVLNEKDYISTKTAYKLNLKGPALSIHTGCSTSLVSIVQAVEAIRSGQTELALAGGISINGQRDLGYNYQQDSILSKDGFCRAFDQNSSGTIFTEGGGVVVLKSLEQAIEDGDYVYSVIKGVALNNDGADKMSFSAPSSIGQQEVITQAVEDAGIDINNIEFVEAHGTGTPIGDPIELSSLQRAYASLGIDQDKKISVSSLKTNIGHLTAAAGVAGLIKAVLSLNSRIVYKNLFFEKANSSLNIDETNFFIPTKNIKVEKEHFNAAVSSFGIGGTNAHVVLENFNNKDEPKQDLFYYLSHKNEDQLKRMCAKLDQDLKKTNINISKSLASRENYKFRSFRMKKCSKWITNSTLVSPKIVFMFPGQGSQFLEMGKSLRESNKYFYHLSEKCFDIANQYLVHDIREIIYGENQDILNNTYYTQPALFIMEYCLAKSFIEIGIEPDMMIGHSIGEFVAATLNGVFKLEDAIQAVCKRSELMSALPRGAMLSVATTKERLFQFLNDKLDIAAVNAKNSLVVSGENEEIEKLKNVLEKNNIASRQLHTSHAFHSKMMNQMIVEYKAFLDTVDLKEPVNGFLSTVTSKIETEEFTKSSYWANHIANTVLFEPTVSKYLETLDSKENYIFLEVGPRATLSTLLKRMDSKIKTLSVGAKELNQEIDSYVGAIGVLKTYGVEIDLSQSHFSFGAKNSQLGLSFFKPSIHWLDITEELNKKDITIKNQGIKEMSTAQFENLKQKIASVFEAASGVDILEYADNTCFFEMGMDSLFLTQVSLQLKNEFGVEISFRQLTEDLADLTSLCTYYMESLGIKEEEKPVEIQVEVKPEIPQAEMISGPSEQVHVNQIQMNMNAQGVESLLQNQILLMQNQLNLLSGAGLAMTTPVASRSEVQKEVVQKSEIKAPQGKSRDHSLKAELNNTKKAFGAIARISTEIESQSVQFVEEFIRDYCHKTKGSKQFTQEARKSHADPRAVTGFKPEHKEMVYPIVVKESKDQILIDIDNNEYIDMLCGFGSNFFGNRNLHIQNCIFEQMNRGFEIGPQHPLTKEVSEMINELTGNERSAFCNTGSEAVLGAMRIARTISGKKKIISFNGSYHGINDEVIIRGSKKGDTFPAAPGINKDSVSNMIVLEYGEDESFQKLVEHVKAGDVAAVIVEPVQSRRSDFHPKEFLQKLRAYTLEQDICLIFDEVITGFRIALGGAQEHFGVRADICTYGKIVGGGMPIGVVSGKAKYLDALDGGHWQYGDDSTPTVGVTYFAGTFVRHPLALAAAKGALEVLKDVGSAGLKDLNAKADLWVQDINNFCIQVGAPLRFSNFGCLMKPKWVGDFKYSDVFFSHLRFNGVHSYDGFPWFINLAHTNAQLDKVKQVIKQSVVTFQSEGLMEGESLYNNTELMHADHPPKPGLRLGKNAEGYPQWFDHNDNEVVSE